MWCMYFSRWGARTVSRAAHVRRCLTLVAELLDALEAAGESPGPNQGELAGGRGGGGVSQW